MPADRTEPDADAIRPWHRRGVGEDDQLFRRHASDIGVRCHAHELGAIVNENVALLEEDESIGVELSVSALQPTTVVANRSATPLIPALTCQLDPRI